MSGRGGRGQMECTVVVLRIYIGPVSLKKLLWAARAEHVAIN